MPTLVILMIVAATAFAFWNANRAAAERAGMLGRNACRAAGVQWLDQSVHQTGMRICRRDDGRLGIERSFRFDYSYQGDDRHVGRLVLRGQDLVSFSGPATPSVSSLH